MFTASCFIKKNTPELINKLIDLGYVKALFDEEYTKSGAYGLIVDQGDIAPLEHAMQEMELMFTYNFVDCGENEDLFLALAALRDDTDKWQLFIFDGIDVPDYFLQKGDMWICSLDNHLVKNCHKATVEEIIEHFKET